MPSRLFAGHIKVIDLQNGNYRSEGGISLFCPMDDNFWFRGAFSPVSSVRTIHCLEGLILDFRGSIESARGGNRTVPSSPFVQVNQQPVQGPGGGSVVPPVPPVPPVPVSVVPVSPDPPETTPEPPGLCRSCFAAALSRPCWPCCSPAATFARFKPLTSPAVLDLGEQCGSHTACAGPAIITETEKAPATMRAKRHTFM